MPPSGARLMPRITIQAFCEHSQTAQLIESATHDRRMSKVALTTHNGGLEGAVETYRIQPHAEPDHRRNALAADQILPALARLAEVCDADHPRHRGRPRQRRGALSRADPRRHFRISGHAHQHARRSSAAITDLFAAEGAAPIGRTIGFISAKGGAGSSTIAHNVAWSIARTIRQDVLILDLDLAFGTAGLNFNQDPPQGMADAVFANEKMDAVMLDRLMSKAANHINLLDRPGHARPHLRSSRAQFRADRGTVPEARARRRARPAACLDRLGAPHPGRYR